MTYVIGESVYRHQGPLVRGRLSRRLHPRGRTMLVIDPEECIDCGACEPECPVEAIFPEDALPEKWRSSRRWTLSANGRRELPPLLGKAPRTRERSPGPGHSGSQARPSMHSSGGSPTSWFPARGVRWTGHTSTHDQYNIDQDSPIT